MEIKSTISLIIILVVTPLSHAARFYIDPEQGSIANDGSESNPWSTLKEVFDSNKISTRKYETKPAVITAPLITKNPDAPVKPGDTLILKNGYHGDIFASEYYNEDYITVMPYPSHTPKIASLELRSGCKWKVIGLTISPSFAPAYSRRSLINFASHNWTGPSRDCIAEACTAYSVIDASGWTKEQWDTLSCNGISFPGANMTAQNNYFKNVNFGISVSGDSCLVEYNTIENFAGDGLRGLGDYGTFQYNIVKNCYAVNANHDDGFQSWSVGDSGEVGTGVVYGVVLRGNTIINYEDIEQPFRGTLQGIGCFDGMFENWRVENNVILTDHWHGITLSGATNCIIVNNTVVDLNTDEPGPPWVRFGDHKDGRKCSSCIIRNNLTTSVNSASEGVTMDHNIVIKKYDEFFVDYASGDLHLKEGCIATDSGASEQAPAIDRDGTQRTHGNGVDVGAYEFGAADILTGESRSHARASFTYSIMRQRIVFSFREPRSRVITIFDLNGRAVHTVRMDNSRSAVLRTTGLHPGTIIVRYDSRNGLAYEKIVLAR